MVIEDRIEVGEISNLETTLHNNLKSLEDGIKLLEKKYLEATTSTGNIVSGWEGFADSKQRSLHFSKAASKRDRKNRNKEYLFSKSSYLQSERNK